MNRRTIRLAAAAFAGGMAAIYFLIGLGVLTVVEAQDTDASLFGFGAMAGGAFLLGAVLLLATDRRWLWILGALLQLFVAVGYFTVAADRTPAFEVWGLTLRIIQVPLFAALVYLALRPTGIRKESHA
ncbi:MAG TPA: hypothetical protein VF365_06425 [Candidatus Limnocylindria bacterium]